MTLVCAAQSASGREAVTAGGKLSAGSRKATRIFAATAHPHPLRWGGGGDTVWCSAGILGLTAPAPAPAVTAVSPASGTTSGGTSVTITGTNLNGATDVAFGGTPATGVTCTGTSCTATSPAHAARSVDGRVTTPVGTSPNTSADDYTYTAPPTGADLATTIPGTPDPVAPGDSFTDPVKVTNHGPQSATGVSTAVAFTGSGSAIQSAP